MEKSKGKADHDHSDLVETKEQAPKSGENVQDSPPSLPKMEADEPLTRYPALVVEPCTEGLTDKGMGRKAKRKDVPCPDDPPLLWDRVKELTFTEQSRKRKSLPVLKTSQEKPLRKLQSLPSMNFNQKISPSEEDMGESDEPKSGSSCGSKDELSLEWNSYDKNTRTHEGPKSKSSPRFGPVLAVKNNRIAAKDSYSEKDQNPEDSPMGRPEYYKVKGPKVRFASEDMIMDFKETQSTMEAVTSPIHQKEKMHSFDGSKEPVKSASNKEEEEAPLIQRAPSTSSYGGVDNFIRSQVKKEASFTDGMDTGFFMQNLYCWDMAMVFPVAVDSNSTPLWLRGIYSEEGKELDVAKVVKRLHKCGLETDQYLSAQEDEVIVKIRCPLPRLEEFAEKIEYMLPLNQHLLKAECEQKYDLKIEHRSNITPFSPYAYHYAPYSRGVKLNKLYDWDPVLRHPFSQIHRIKLIHHMIERKDECDIDWVRMLDNKRLLGYFPLHNKIALEELRARWFPRNSTKYLFNPGNQPLWRIKEYLGEKEALYFALLGHYTQWLGYLSVMGLVVCLNDVVERSTESRTAPFFCLFVAFWCIFKMEFWKRKQAMLAMQWGMTDFQKFEQDRIHFKGVLTTSHIDGQPMTYFPHRQRRKRIIISHIIMTTLVLVVFGALVSLYFFKLFLSSLDGTVYARIAPYFANVLNSIRIQVMNQVYTFIAVKLTDKENHQTDTQYENALIMKMMMFQGVNSYSTFFYIAFLKHSIEGCGYGENCMHDLLISLAIIFGMEIIATLSTEIYIPKLKAKLNRCRELQGTDGKQLTDVELEYTLVPCDRMMQNIRNFSMLVIQFGYVTMFVTAFPAAPLLAWVANCVKIQVDAHKLLYEHQRVLPTSKENIGIWRSVLMAFSLVAAITNAGLVCFTMENFVLKSDSIYTTATRKIWCFLILQYILFGIMAAFEYVVDDVSEEVQIQLERNEVIRKKVIDPALREERSLLENL